MEPTAKQIIEKAITTLQTKGWCQGTLEDSNGQMCALGALGVMPYGYYRLGKTDRIAIVAVARAVSNNPLPGPGNFSVSRISRWNDQPGRTKEQVIAVFQKALERI